MPGEKILLIDEDKKTCETLKEHIEKAGYEPVFSYNGRDVLSKIDLLKPCMVIMEAALSGADGWQICKDIRKVSDVPVIILTVRREVFDRILGLELGADDYIVKPFDPKEVVARVRAVLRRYVRGAEHNDAEQVGYDRIYINLTEYVLRVDGNNVYAPPKEIELLYFLASHPNKVFTRDQILDNVWGMEYYGDLRTVDVHIKRLRSKLNGVSDKWEIATVWGRGYKFELKESSDEGE